MNLRKIFAVFCVLGGMVFFTSNSAIAHIGEFIADTRCCNIFYQCDANNLPRRFSCTAQLGPNVIWNQHTQTCVWVSQGAPNCRTGMPIDCPDEFTGFSPVCSGGPCNCVDSSSDVVSLDIPGGRRNTITTTRVCGGPSGCVCGSCPAVVSVQCECDPGYTENTINGVCNCFQCSGSYYVLSVSGMPFCVPCPSYAETGISGTTGAPYNASVSPTSCYIPASVYINDGRGVFNFDSKCNYSE